MLNALRAALVEQLWSEYRRDTRQVNPILQALQQKGMARFYLDHFAVIDLPGRHTGRAPLAKIFSLLGFVERGHGYLPDRVNDFTWLAEQAAETLPATAVLPQVVIADFRLDELPPEVREIIVRYADLAPPSPLARMECLLNDANISSTEKTAQIKNILLNYFRGRDWPLPNCREFYTVHEYNELLAWVLVFGRKPNHFTLSVHLLNYFPNMENFCDFIEHEVGFELNNEGGKIKGGAQSGIAQSSTVGQMEKILLADGEIELATDFVEFVWRYPVSNATPPILWSDYFTDFIAQHANQVIESLIQIEK